MKSSIGTRMFLCDLFSSINGLQAVYVEPSFTLYDNNPTFFLHSYIHLDTATILEKLYEYYKNSGVKLYSVVGMDANHFLLEGRRLLWRKDENTALTVWILE